MHRAYYEQHKEEVIAKTCAWQKAHPDKVREYKAKSRCRVRAERPWQSILYCAKSRAVDLGIAFDLTTEWCFKTWTGRCALTGEAFDLGPKINGRPFSPSLDRIDAKGGYTQDNCRFVLWAINRFKSDGSDELMLRLARALIAKSD
jgi:hypothetical protein